MIVQKASQFGKHFGSMCGLFPCLLHLFALFVACNLVQTLVETQLVHNCKKAIASYRFANPCIMVVHNKSESSNLLKTSDVHKVRTTMLVPSETFLLIMTY